MKLKAITTFLLPFCLCLLAGITMTACSVEPRFPSHEQHEMDNIRQSIKSKIKDYTKYRAGLHYDDDGPDWALYLNVSITLEDSDYTDAMNTYEDFAHFLVKEVSKYSKEELDHSIVNIAVYPIDNSFFITNDTVGLKTYESSFSDFIEKYGD